MAQKYRIYINDNSFFIGDQPLKNGTEIQQLDSQNFDFVKFYKKLRGKKGRCFQLVTDDPEQAFKKIKKECVLLQAAGGLVTNARGEYLFIYRNNKWDLPKGKLEPSEKTESAAVREVEEECGVKISELQERICATYHVYVLDRRVIMKKTTWFSKHVEGVPDLIPQAEEGITIAAWVAADDMKPQKDNTYPSILEVLTTALPPSADAGNAAIPE